MTHTAPTNADRAQRCEDTLRLYNDEWDPRTNLIDLLADARHWCDRHQLSYAELDRMAHDHYLAELGEERTQP